MQIPHLHLFLFRQRSYRLTICKVLYLKVDFRGLAKTLSRQSYTKYEKCQSTGHTANQSVDLKVTHPECIQNHPHLPCRLCHPFHLGAFAIQIRAYPASDLFQLDIFGFRCSRRWSWHTGCSANSCFSPRYMW